MVDISLTPHNAVTIRTNNALTNATTAINVMVKSLLTCAKHASVPVTVFKNVTYDMF